MDKTANQKESFLALQWTIKNFSCWKKELHDASIKCESKMIHGLEIALYPKGMNGTREHLELMVINRNSGVVPLLCGEVSLFLSKDDESWRNQIDSPIGHTNVIIKWPKHKYVLGIILKKDDKITVEYRTRSRIDIVERICTTIFFLEKYVPLTSNELVGLESTEKTLDSLQWHLDDNTEERMDLRGVQHPQDRSKICLLLVPTRLRQSVFTLTRGSSKKITRHMFRKVSEKLETAILTKAEVGREGFPLFYYVKVVPVRSPTHVYSQGLPEKSDLANRPMAAGLLSDPSTNPVNLVDANPPDRPMAASASGLYQQNHKSLASNEKEDHATIRRLGEQANAEWDSNENSPVSMDNPSTLPHIGGQSPVHVPHLVVPDVLEIHYNAYLNYPSWDHLINFYSAAVHYQIQDLVQQLAGILQRNLTVSNMCDVLILAIRRQDPNLLQEVHRFFAHNRQEALLNARWNSVDPRLTYMFFAEFDRD